MGEISISIKNGKAKIMPKAVEKGILQELSDIALQLCKIFNKNFYKQFTNSKNSAELTINTHTALIEKFSQNGIIVEIVEYENLFTSKIPSKLKFTFSAVKIKGSMEATKILSILDTEKNENKDQISGKN
ncbi:MAG: hypothetical protein LBQ13_03410 [Endomicrobium sp.]|jgi:hypothetical protein|nr:hypothetical protein [Endomicrobium sp.]